MAKLKDLNPDLSNPAKVREIAAKHVKDSSAIEGIAPPTADQLVKAKKIRKSA